jgi:asparagine synthase (glutamine-hydrolysing)
MCGIIGVASSDSINDRDWLAAGRDAMIHRGPNDAGLWWSDDGRVGLAQRRLSIIDLSARGHQPMQDPSARLTLIFNGEIYNFIELRDQLIAKGYAFQSQSDTEVILNAYREWGTDCLSHLNGMFAIALYDSNADRLFLARDRAGEKPLFYSHNGGSLRFSSELKGLMADPAFDRSIDRDALDSYLATGYVAGEACILRSARKLPPAHALIFDLRQGSVRQWRYWHLPDAPSHDCGPGRDGELVDELEALLADAVQKQLVADVPVGVLLSGGVDSSLVTAMAVRASSHVKTFTVGFEGHSAYDESNYAKLVAEHFGTEHIELQAGSVNPDFLNTLAREYDEPIIDSSMIPTHLVSALVRRHCTVALGGDGGDELFGGYETHRRVMWAQAKIGNIPLWARKLASTGASMLLPTGFKGRNWLQAIGTDFDSELTAAAGHFDPSERRALLGRDWPTTAEVRHAERVPHTMDLLQRTTRMDFENYLPEDILVKVDRASMLASLEMRAPLLDFRIAEFAFGKVPSRLKANPRERKILLKQLCARVLPAQFDARRKQGFSIPLPAWLRAGPWHDFVRSVLLDSQCLFDQVVVRELLDGHQHGRNNSERLFGLTLFELWRRAYDIPQLLPAK